jgi:hypothetical protein
MRRCRPRLAARRRFVRRSRDKASAQVSTDRMKTVLREKLGLKRNAAPSGRISYDIPHPLRTRGATLVGTWLSLVEHSLGVRGVGSSNLPVPTNSPQIPRKERSRFRLRAPASLTPAKRLKFKSARPDQFSSQAIGKASNSALECHHVSVRIEAGAPVCALHEHERQRSFQLTCRHRA